MAKSSPYLKCAISSIVCSLITLISFVATYFFINGGSILVPIEARKSYLNANLTQWSLGWILWILSSAALFAFYFFTAKIVAEGHTNNKALGVAIMIALLGVSFSISAFIGSMMLPYLTGNTAIFLERQWLFNFMSEFIANVLYIIAGTMIFYVAYVRKTFPKWLILISIPPELAAYWLCAATIKYCPECMEYSLAALIPLLSIWLAIFGVWAFNKSKAL